MPSDRSKFRGIRGDNNYFFPSVGIQLDTYAKGESERFAVRRSQIKSNDEREKDKCPAFIPYLGRCSFPL